MWVRVPPGPPLTEKISSTDILLLTSGTDPHILPDMFTKTALHLLTQTTLYWQHQYSCSSL